MMHLLSSEAFSSKALNAAWSFVKNEKCYAACKTSCQLQRWATAATIAATTPATREISRPTKREGGAGAGGRQILQRRPATTNTEQYMPTYASTHIPSCSPHAGFENGVDPEDRKKGQPTEEANQEKINNLDYDQLQLHACMHEFHGYS